MQWPGCIKQIMGHQSMSLDENTDLNGAPKILARSCLFYFPLLFTFNLDFHLWIIHMYNTLAIKTTLTNVSDLAAHTYFPPLLNAQAYSSLSY